MNRTRNQFIEHVCKWSVILWPNMDWLLIGISPPNQNFICMQMLVEFYVRFDVSRNEENVMSAFCVLDAPAVVPIGSGRRARLPSASQPENLHHTKINSTIRKIRNFYHIHRKSFR